MRYLVGAAGALIGFIIGVAWLGLSAKPDSVSFSPKFYERLVAPKH
ncbi:hypothetical protein [Roseovarius spongiae]|nr:hypothetical protein [Roseovarius spongiae]